METEYLGNAYTTQSSNDGCVAVACPIDKDSIDDLKKYLTSIKKNRIIIISTHDKNIVDLADVTINLDKGHIFEAEVL